MLEFLRNKKILVVVAHPDDELLGQGGTMNKLIGEYGCTIGAVILGEGITSRSEVRDVEKWNKELELHRANIEAAKNCIGYQFVNTYNFPDNRFDNVDLLDIVKVVEKEKSSFEPEIIFTHHNGDVNIDHQKVHEAVLTATRPLQGEKVRAVITFETPSSTEWQFSNSPFSFRPNLFVEISEKNLQAKIDGMESYVFEKRPFPHPRSSEALAIYAQRWGVTIGCKYAEAFSICRLLA